MSCQTKIENPYYFLLLLLHTPYCCISLLHPVTRRFVSSLSSSFSSLLPPFSYHPLYLSFYSRVRPYCTCRGLLLRCLLSLSYHFESLPYPVLVTAFSNLPTATATLYHVLCHCLRNHLFLKVLLLVYFALAF